MWEYEFGCVCFAQQPWEGGLRESAASCTKGWDIFANSLFSVTLSHQYIPSLTPASSKLQLVTGWSDVTLDTAVNNISCVDRESHVSCLIYGSDDWSDRCSSVRQVKVQRTICKFLSVQTCICLINFCFYACLKCINKSLHLFPIFLQHIKEIRGDSRLMPVSDTGVSCLPPRAGVSFWLIVCWWHTLMKTWSWYTLVCFFLPICWKSNFRRQSGWVIFYRRHMQDIIFTELSRILSFPSLNSWFQLI